MKTHIKTLIRTITALPLLIIVPMAAFGSTTGGGAIGGQLQITQIIWDIVDFLTGPIAIALIVLGFIVGAGTIAVARQNDAAGWQRLGKVIIGATIAFGAIGLVNLFFGGAVI
jgi:type IV secretory pathway VirB2 component (pilin)